MRLFQVDRGMGNVGALVGRRDGGFLGFCGREREGSVAGGGGCRVLIDRDRCSCASTSTLLFYAH